MNKQIKQELFNRVLTAIRIQGLGASKLYDEKSKRMCSLGFLWSDLYGVDRLKRVLKTKYHVDIDSDIRKDLVAAYGLEIDDDYGFLLDLQFSHDGAKGSISRFENEMKDIALVYKLKYNEPMICKVIEFPKPDPNTPADEEALPEAA
jgi:hypothetical protein